MPFAARSSSTQNDDITTVILSWRRKCLDTKHRPSFCSNITFCAASSHRSVTRVQVRLIPTCIPTYCSLGNLGSVFKAETPTISRKDGIVCGWCTFVRDLTGQWPLSRASIHQRSRGWFRSSGSNRSHEEYTKPAGVSVCLNHIRPLLANYSPTMPYLAASTSSLNSAERTGRGLGRGATSGEVQQQRYASFPCYAYWLVS